MEDRLLTLAEAGEMLGVSRMTLLRRIADGSLPAIDLAPDGSPRATWRIRVGALLAYVDERQAVAR